MKLKQINLNYQAGQDRILLRVSTHSGLEYQAWLTRRIVQRLVPALDQLYELDTVQQAPDAQSRAAVREFRQSNALQQANFKPEYEADGLAPGHEGEPLLVYHVRLRRLEAGQYLLVLSPEAGDGLQLRFNEVLLHATRKLLIDTQQRAGWGLFGTPPVTTPETAASVAAERLN